MYHVPRRRRSRSSSPKPSLQPSRDYSVASSRPSPGPSVTLALSPRPPSRLTVPEQRANTTTVPSAFKQPINPQNSTQFNSNSLPAPRVLTPLGTSGPNLAQATAHDAHSPYHSAGMFNQAHGFTVAGGTFVDSSVTYNHNNVSSNQFMEKLLEKTIAGAEFDSSDRDPPPRCHPGTRLAVLKRCLDFISNCDNVKKMRWVVGAAGVGKSAIMQSIAESPDLPVNPPASVFFSINGRDDGSKAVITLSYQFATKSDLYRQLIEREVLRDPSLLRSSLAKQFKRLIVEPFIHNAQLNSAGRVLIIIDGLDECKDLRTQQELLRLISGLCLAHPSSPLVWLIASRPEPHITSFFSRHNVIPVYEKEEIPVDSGEACTDVERFLRAKLTEIKEDSDLLDTRWPKEQDFWKVANAAGGLFAYAQTVVRYIGDPVVGNPVSQLVDVLHIIDERSITNVSREEHPMALLDALYERILSNVPHKIMNGTRKLLLALASDWNLSEDFTNGDRNFIMLCNWLGMTADEAYAAVNHLRSVLYVPRRDVAHRDNLKAFHKSFIDYISDYTRSGFSLDIRDEACQFNAQCALRILNEVPNGIELVDSRYTMTCGRLVQGTTPCARISLTWVFGEACDANDDETRSDMYRLAIRHVVCGIKQGNVTFHSKLGIQILTTAFTTYFSGFPCNELLDIAFDESRRLELMMHGILMRIHLADVSVSGLYGLLNIKLQLRRPATIMANLFDPWNSSCKHERKGEYEAGIYNWTTTFRKPGYGMTPPEEIDCAFCSGRLERQLRSFKVHPLDDSPLAMFTSTGHCGVQVRLVDPEDMSEWTYTFWCYVPWEDRNKYKSPT